MDHSIDQLRTRVHMYNSKPVLLVSLSLSFQCFIISCENLYVKQETLRKERESLGRSIKISHYGYKHDMGLSSTINAML